MPARDPYEYFRVEARELLESLNRGVLSLEKDGAQAETVLALLRQAHTLKGAARVVRLTEMADTVHAFEEALNPWRQGGQAPPSLSESLLRFLDSLGQHLSKLDAPLPTSPAPRPKEHRPLPIEQRFETVRLEVAELDQVLESLREASGKLDQLRRDAKGLERARKLAQALSGAAQPAARQRSMALELESILARFDRSAIAALEQAEREVFEAQEKASQMRMLPASALFTFLERSIRDAASELGKEVHFETLGGEQRLDAPVLSALQEALQHVVRNAVTHGIEDAALRLKRGKPKSGRIRIEIQQRGNHVLVQCDDDGAGIDPKEVRKAAIKRGLLPSGASDAFSMEEAIKLLLSGGISTANQVTELSGRGLGLDVLRSRVQSLKGELRIKSQAGQGTQIVMEVPQSLSSYPVLEVEAAGIMSLIPFSAVESAVLAKLQDLAHSAGGETLDVEGQLLPYLPLQAHFEGSPSLRGGPTVVLRNSKEKIALGVERIHGVREAVVLPLPELVPLEGLALGASLDAAGNPCMVLNPEGLAAAARAWAAPEASGLKAGAQLLVIDDSLTTRMLEQSILETAGFAVDLANSAEEGLAKLREKAYALILVDVEMPGMDGFEFLEALKKEPLLHQIPAILVSSRASTEDRRRGTEAGARGYIDKGEFDQARLLHRIQELLA